MAYLDFTEMPVWQEAAEIVAEVYTLTIKLPKCEDYALRGQLRDAAVSITGNIAEGFGRSGNQDKSHFYIYARASAFEVRSHLLVGVKVGYFMANETLAIDTRCRKVVSDLNKIIKGLSQP